MNNLSNVTNERLREISEGKWCDSGLEQRAIASELLARREAAEKPVLWEISNPGEGTYYTVHKPSESDCRHSLIVAELFTAPPLPVVPDGYAIVPRKLTAENGAKGALLGEFLESKYINCPECFGDDECESCDGSGRIKVDVTVSWSTIKNIYSAAVDLLGNPEQVNSPVTPDGSWMRRVKLPELFEDDRHAVTKAIRDAGGEIEIE